MLQFRRKQRTHLGISSCVISYDLSITLPKPLTKKTPPHTHTNTNFLYSNHWMSKHSYTPRDPLSSCTIAQATAYNTQTQIPSCRFPPVLPHHKSKNKGCTYQSDWAKWFLLKDIHKLLALQWHAVITQQTHFFLYLLIEPKPTGIPVLNY